MFTSNAAASSYPLAKAATEAPATIATRFGELAYDPVDTVDMPRGMPGFPGHQRFAFASLPDPNHASLRVMQSLADPAVSFLVTTIEESHGLFGPDDLAEAHAVVGVAPEDLAIVVVVSVRRQPGTIQISANLRAPFLIDTRSGRAVQFVLSNSALSVRHTISTVETVEQPVVVK